MTEQERKALEMVVNDNAYLDVDNLEDYHEHDICGITTGRSGRDIAWAWATDRNNNSAWNHRYIDTLEPLSDEQAADELE